ncbi:hypothetical protein [Anaeromicropila herbilytica]|uniref:Uncharacterized protein n=1 Tax=Anaeromicropila herbilytica TaxID=2785025 RepID=A0A7R7IBG9_9FIRM|nr:hypothetical protein [Anaeromicropila herbilytica]BCN29602.1 hypothetical protein bsdtb5_08970 [Anaeromicropila herbilytica]
MKIGNTQNQDTSNIYISNSESHNNLRARNSSNNKKKQVKGGTIFAGDLNISQQENSTMKKVRAQKAALKAIMDQNKKELKIDDNLSNREKHRTELANEAKANLDEVDKIDGLKKQLKDAYQVADDSPEQKNLELLEKSMDPNQTLTDDEMNQLKQMGPLTEYQKNAIEYDAMQQIWQKRADDALNERANEGKSIEAIKLGRLKTHEMLDCQKEAADIIDKVNKEILGDLYKEAKDKLDDKIKNKDDKDKDKKDDTANKKDDVKDEKGKTAEASNDKTIQKPNVPHQEDNNLVNNNAVKNNNPANDPNQIQNIDNTLQQLQTEMKYVVKNNKMLLEDIKGIALDEQV